LFPRLAVYEKASEEKKQGKNDEWAPEEPPYCPWRRIGDILFLGVNTVDCSACPFQKSTREYCHATSGKIHKE